MADSLLWPSLRIRFRVLADAPKLQDPNKVISLIQQEKGYTVSSEWRPEPFFFFVFTNRLSIDRNVEALIRFVKDAPFKTPRVRIRRTRHVIRRPEAGFFAEAADLCL